MLELEGDLPPILVSLVHKEKDSQRMVSHKTILPDYTHSLFDSAYIYVFSIVSLILQVIRRLRPISRNARRKLMPTCKGM